MCHFYKFWEPESVLYHCVHVAYVVGVKEDMDTEEKEVETAEMAMTNNAGLPKNISTNCLILDTFWINVNFYENILVFCY